MPEYSMKQVVADTGLSERTLFRYIREGKVSPTKNPRGRWVFTEEDVDQIMLVSQRSPYKQKPRQIPRTVIAVVNNKGGVGKTTTVLNLAYEWARSGYKVLAVDLDAQASLTDIFSDTGSITQKPSILNYITGEISARDMVMETDYFDIIPSNLLLAKIEVDIRLMPRSYGKLTQLLNELPDYHIIVIDTPPNLAILTQLALEACDYILIPVQASYLAMEGMSNLDNYLRLVSEIPDVDKKQLGIVITMYSRTESMSRVVLRQLRAEQRELVCNTIVRRNRAVDTAQADIGPVAIHAPQSYGAVDYADLSVELLQRVEEKS